MSADKRKQILIGFAGLAVVLVVVIALVSPKFKSEDAMGAIGAVQKHHAPQIAQKDVILGDEQLKQQQQVLYGDFLADASALQNISENISTAARSESASRLSARAQELQSRYFAAAKAQVLGMTKLPFDPCCGAKALESLEADVNAAASRANLSSVEMEALNSRLESMAAAFEKNLGSRNLASIDADVAGLGARLESAKNLDGARSTLAAAAHALDARSNAASMIRARADYLGATAKEARIILQSEDALSAGSRAESMLRDEAQSLSQRAVLNMKDNLSSATADVDSFAHMRASLDSVSKSVDSRANLYSRASLASFRQDAASFARAVEARSAEAASRASVEMRGQLASISSYLGSVSKLDSRNAASRASVAECTAQLSSINMAARSNALYASVLANSQELAAYSQKSRTQ